jgi:superoxide reductase
MDIIDRDRPGPPSTPPTPVDELRPAPLIVIQQQSFKGSGGERPRFFPSARKEMEMAEQGKTYRCEICGQEVKVLKEGAGTLVCCNQDMVLVD